jgi:hypothetical protein
VSEFDWIDFVVNQEADHRSSRPAPSGRYAQSPAADAVRPNHQLCWLTINRNEVPSEA